MHKLESIQVLRALAAVAVVIAHLDPSMPAVSAAGVDVFFVISGFVMGAFALRATPGQFLFHRIVRIVPLYWGITLFMCLVSLAGVFSTFSFTPDELWKSLLFIPYVNPQGLLAPLVIVGWTLNLEMFFYAVFALGLALRAPIAVTVLVLLAMVIAGQAVSFQSPILQMWTSVLLVEFLAGLVLSQLAFSNRRGGFLALFLAVVGFAAASFIGAPDGLLRLAAWGAPAFLLVLGCVWIEKSGTWPDRAFKRLALLGDASYALYLTHGLTLSLVGKFLQPGLAFALASLTLSIVVALLVHLLIEKPLVHRLKRIWPSRRSEPPTNAMSRQSDIERL